MTSLFRRRQGMWPPSGRTAGPRLRARRHIRGASRLLFLLAAGLGLWLPAARCAPKPVLEVLCGPALRPPVVDLLSAFEKRAGVCTEVSYDASGALLGQLRLRPHGDVLLPADRAYTDEAVARGLAESPRAVAVFRPVILVAKGNPRAIRAVADLTRPGLRVGIGEERTTAIGKTTLALLKRNHIPVKRVPFVYRAGRIDELANAVRLGSIDAAVVWDLSLIHI